MPVVPALAAIGGAMGVGAAGAAAAGGLAVAGTAAGAYSAIKVLIQPVDPPIRRLMLPRMLALMFLMLPHKQISKLLRMPVILLR